MSEPGMYLVHKEPGRSSFEVLQAFRTAHPPSALRKLPMSHAGALDPFAHGLLLVLVGPATRLMPALHVAPKHYEAEVVWGAQTDSDDAGGHPILLPPTAPKPLALTPERLSQALRPHLGWVDQIPPPTSNKRVNGERAWVRAHRGETFTLPPSRVYLHEAHWRSHHFPSANVSGTHVSGWSALSLTSGGGYYVRALARDLGQALGVGAHLRALHRSRIGPWDDPGPGQHIFVAGQDVLPWLPTRALSDAELGALRQRQPVPRGALVPPAWPLPAGIVPPPSVMAVHQGRLLFVLRPSAPRLDMLEVEVDLGRGLHSRPPTR